MKSSKSLRMKFLTSKKRSNSITISFSKRLLASKTLTNLKNNMAHQIMINPKRIMRSRKSYKSLKLRFLTTAIKRPKLLATSKSLARSTFLKSTTINWQINFIDKMYPCQKHFKATTMTLTPLSCKSTTKSQMAWTNF